MVLISVDTLRADHLGCYGYTRPTSPAIDALAARGVLFEQASSTGAWTVPSHMSMLTGLYAGAHGIDGWQQRLPEDVETLAERLSDGGFATGAIVNVHLLDEERGFARGFETYEIVDPAIGPEGSTTEIVARARAWIEERGDEPYFLFLHLYDVHSDFDPTTRYRTMFGRRYEGPVDGSTAQLRAFRTRRAAGDAPDWGADEAARLVDLYDAGIRQLDDDLAPLLDFLAREERRGETLVVLTADHGEEFLERGDVLHGRTLHQELVRVPLVLAGPGIPPGARVAAAVSLVDVAPTMLSLAGLAPPEGVQGVDLAAAWSDSSWAPERSIFAEADKWLGQAEGNYRRSVRRGRYVLHYDFASGRKQLFDLESDPGERHDLLGEQEVLADVMWRTLEAFEAEGIDVGDELELTDEDVERLRKLGYF